MEAATAGEYDEKSEQTLGMLQRRGDNSIKAADKSRQISYGCLRDWWWLAAVCDHPWGRGLWLLLSWRDPQVQYLQDENDNARATIAAVREI